MRMEFETGTYRRCCPDLHFEDINLSSIGSDATIWKPNSELPIQNGKTAINGQKNQPKSARIANLPIKLYKRRFTMLFIISFCAMMNGLPQFQYTVVADIIACYYNVSLDQVNWAALLYMVVYLPLVFPVMYLMDVKGLRITVLLGGCFNLLGSLVQCFSFAPTHYTLVMVCQTLYAIGQVFVLSLPPFVAGVWFGAEEVGMACVMGVFGNQLGIALGFIIPPLVLTNDCHDQKDLTHQLGILAYPQVAINFMTLLLIIFAYEEKPEKFPSIAQATKARDDPDYVASLKAVLTDIPFILLLVAYGLITGVYLAMSTIMNEMVLTHFKGKEKDAGWMGAIMVFAGMVGSVILGAFQDRTHKYKQISLLAFTLSFLLMFTYTFVIKLEQIWVQYVFFTLLGLIMTGYLPIGYDFGAEITYPEPEAISGSLLNASMQLFGLVFSKVAALLLQKYGDFSSNMLLSASLLLGIILIAFMKCNLKRTTSALEAMNS